MRMRSVNVTLPPSGSPARWLALGLLTLLAPAPAAAQKTPVGDQLSEISRIVGTRSSNIFCHPEGQSERLNSVGVDFVWNGRDRALLVHEDTGAPTRDGYLFFIPAFSPQVTVARGACDGVVMWRVELTCDRPCKVRFRQTGKASAADALARQGQAERDQSGFYFGLIEEADAQRVASLLRSVITTARAQP